VKNKLEHPYYFYSYDQPKAGLYSLYEKNETIVPQEFYFDFLDEKATCSAVAFEQIPLHVLLKVLLANFFKVRIQLVCQNKFYILAKEKTALSIELREYINNSSDNPQKEFHLISHAEKFYKPKSDSIKEFLTKFVYYYEKIECLGTSYLRQIKPNKVMEHKDKSEIYCAAKKDRKSPAKLDHFSINDEIEFTRSYILDTFQQEFVEFLLKNGVVAEIKKRYFDKMNFEMSPALPIDELKTIYVFDNRLKLNGKNINTIPFEDYIRLLQHTYSKEFGVNFESISENEFDKNTPVLLLQDVSKNDFAIDEDTKELIGLLAKQGIEDPKQRIYKKYMSMPKQTISVNPHKSNEYKTIKDYLNYEIISIESYDNKFRKCFDDLYLKDLLLNQKNIRHLPCIETFENYIFIHHLTFLSIKNGCFIIRKFDTNKKLLNQKLEPYEISWSDIVDIYRSKYKKEFENDELTDKEKEEKIGDWLNNAYFVIGKEGVFEIETMDERVLYDTKEIKNRYDKRKEEKESEGKKFRYDSLNPKAPTLLEGYEGIWYNPADKFYFVGSKSVFKFKQPKAHLIRKFDFYEKKDQCDLFSKPQKQSVLLPLLQSMAVPFVRNEQYTVYPYFFDLIRLYIENNDI